MPKLGDIPLKSIFVACILTVVGLLVLAVHDNTRGPQLVHHTLPTLQQWVVIALITCGVGIAFAACLRRFWSLPLRQLLDATREGAADQEPVIAGRGELALLAHALTRIHRRHRRTLTELEIQRALLTALIHQIHEGVIVANAAGRIELLNPAAERMLALRSEGTEPKGSFLGLAIERAIPQHDIQRLLHAGRATDQTARTERHPAPDEEATLVVEHGTHKMSIFARAADLTMPGRDSTSVLSRFVVLVDTTELSKALQMKADFVANASHELRTPLSTIRAAVETLMQLDLATETEDAERFIKLVDRSSARLSEMVSDLLDLSRVESPGGSHAVREINIPALLSEIHDRFRDRMAEKSLQWDQTIQGTPQILVASPYLIQLILDNLIDNAIKFSPENATLHVAANFEPGQLEFVVADQGCGIPTEDQQRVFERFYQVHRARGGVEKRGTGLGLAIVKHSVNVLKGLIKLESRVGHGTRITIRIPLASPSRDAANAAENSFKDRIPPQS
ncbi:MAG: sensor histidine kinase [Phycisphaerae bacterium]